MMEPSHLTKGIALPELRDAARWLARQDRNACLMAMRQGIVDSETAILSANQQDVENAKQTNMSDALLDRLALSQTRLTQLIASFDQVIALPDPVGRTLTQWQHANGMTMRKISVPFGVIGMIYESRPNVTVDAAMLCVKAGSAVILRGSSNALASNRALTTAMQQGLQSAGLRADVMHTLDSGDRREVDALLQARGKIDLLIPRGGAALIAHVVENARVPVIETGTGVCHLYVHASADLPAALAILRNGKVQRPGVCNALESLLIDASIAKEFCALAVPALQAEHVEMRGCQRFCALVPSAKLASHEDYAAEFLDLILSVKIVDDLDHAIQHIQQFGTQHSEVICCTDPAVAQQFQQEIDAAAIYVNASSRFTDGFEFGFGAEIGISTQKMHARGPMGLAEMVSYKYLIDGQGQIR
jgi:glutamate-5-semialdehyde dehydrogenase